MVSAKVASTCISTIST